MRLIELLNEKKDEKDEKDSAGAEDFTLRTISAATTPLMSGRPSSLIRSIRQRASEDPAGLLKDLGIASIKADNVKYAHTFLYDAFKQMISDSSGNKKAKYLSDIFETPEMVKSNSGKNRGVMIKLTSEGLDYIKKSGSKTFIRTYAFWISSTIEALQNVNDRLNLELDVNSKVQWLSSENAILVYKSRDAWKNL